MTRPLFTPSKKSLNETEPALALPAPAALDFAAREFRKTLQIWYRRHARRLPWRGVNDPYATWLSEIMLQQTRVATVIDRYRQFLLRFPTISALAQAEEADVLALWSGLGYYRRARMLHRGAQFVERELGGKLPRTSVELRTLPGVGDYTSAAIASIAFGESIAVVDGNVERVLLRILGLAEQPGSKARVDLARVAQSLMPARRKSPAGTNAAGDHNQAMMELGATICLPRAPLCLQCPVFDFCKTRGEHVTPARERQQSRMVAYLLAVRKRGTATEVLLERRAAEASLMPGMLELPPLPLDAATGREPVLRLRHSITNTNYYVQIYTESAPGIPAPRADATEGIDAEEEEAANGDEEDLYVADAAELSTNASLIQEIPAAAAQLEWFALPRLGELPLTGLARKTLQRLKLMSLPSVVINLP